ncbi:LOW QUALITY PROTEIN: hypothetical protein HID58_096114, partial [Brassica napus]
FWTQLQPKAHELIIQVEQVIDPLYAPCPSRVAAGGPGEPARRAISSVVGAAPDNCVVVPGLRIDGAIQVRSNVDPTFYSLVGSGRSGGDHNGSSLLENPYIPYQLSLERRGLEKIAINRIFLILPSERKNVKFFSFPPRNGSRKRGGTSTLGERSTTGELCDDLLHGRGSDSFMLLHLAGGWDIAQLVELRSCNWVVAITGWYGSYMDGSWSRRLLGFPRLGLIPVEEDQVGPCEQLMHYLPSNPLSEMRQKEGKIHGPTPSSPPRRNYEITQGRLRVLFGEHSTMNESCKLCSWGSSCLSLASMNQSGPDRRGGLPCGGCHSSKSAYLQLVNLADTKLYDSTQFFHSAIFPFSSTLGWHSLKVRARFKRERLTVDT